MGSGNTIEATNKIVRQGSNFPNLTIMWPVSSLRGTCMQVKGNMSNRIARVKLLLQVGTPIVLKGSQSQALPT